MIWWAFIPALAATYFAWYWLQISVFAFLKVLMLHSFVTWGIKVRNRHSQSVKSGSFTLSHFNAESFLSKWMLEYIQDCYIFLSIYNFEPDDPVKHLKSFYFHSRINLLLLKERLEKQPTIKIRPVAISKSKHTYCRGRNTPKDKLLMS